MWRAEEHVYADEWVFTEWVLWIIAAWFFLRCFCLLFSRWLAGWSLYSALLGWPNLLFRRCLYSCARVSEVLPNCFLAIGFSAALLHAPSPEACAVEIRVQHS